MAEICNNGYKDALVYLKENGWKDYNIFIYNRCLFCLEQHLFMTEFIANHRQNQSGSTRGKSSALDKQEVNLLPALVQKGNSTLSCLLTRKRNHLYRLLMKI